MTHMNTDESESRHQKPLTTFARSLVHVVLCEHIMSLRRPDDIKVTTDLSQQRAKSVCKTDEGILIFSVSVHVTAAQICNFGIVPV